MFTRQHYKRIAEILKKYRKAKRINDKDWEFSELVSEFVIMFGEDNWRFNPEKFKNAVYSD